MGDFFFYFSFLLFKKLKNLGNTLSFCNIEITHVFIDSYKLIFS